MPDDNELIDRIYEAAIVPEFWPKVLQSISDLSASVGGVLFTTNNEVSDWVASPEMAPIASEYFGQGWGDRNPRPARAVALRLSGFVSDHDLFSPKEIDADPYYQHMRKIGLGWCAGIVTPLPHGDAVVFTWARRYEWGPFKAKLLEPLSGIAGHLNRSAMVAARLGLEKARAAAEAMNIIGLPAATLSPSGRLIFANDPFQQFMPALVQDRMTRLTVNDPRADALLETALARIASNLNLPHQVQSIPLAEGGRRRPMVLHVIPIRRAAHDIFDATSTMLVLTALTSRAGPDATIIQGLFDLTPAEARIALAIAAGVQPTEIARKQGVSVETVRTQLKSIFLKTGTTRQLELARLLARTTLP